MNRHFLVLTVVILSLGVSGAILAQDNNSLGTWKLNVEKSKYNAGMPKSLTRTVKAQGDSVKYSYEGVNADGGPLAYSFTVKYDGNDYSVTGSGMPDGADTIAIKRIDPNTFQSTLKRAGKVVGTATTAVSANGKVTTLTYKGTDEGGKPTNRMSVFDKE
jgi:hypothetical protein